MNKRGRGAGRTPMQPFAPGLSLVLFLVSWIGLGTFSTPAAQPAGTQAGSTLEKKTTASPSFSFPGGVYSNSVLVKLSGSTPGSVIHYSVDGSEPSEASPAFSEPIRISGSTLLRAKAFAAGFVPSVIVCQTYTILDESLLNWSSNLPVVILHTFRGYVSHDTKTPVSARFINNPAGRNFLTGPADFDGRGTLKVRGRSSLEYRKHSFNFHAQDETETSVKIPLLGLPKESEWVLYAPYPDKTLMRDALAYELSGKMGRYAPRTRFVELFASQAGARLSRRSYMGVYVLVEKVKRSKRRVDIAKLGPDDNAEPAISGGYIFKRDHWDKGKPSFTTSRGSHFYYVEPKSEEITSAQKQWLSRYLDQFERALYGPNFRDRARGYPAFLDIDSVIDHHWIVELSKNVDGIRFSNFLSKDRGGKLKMEPIWDWNLSFGNASGRQGWNPEGWYWSQLDDTEYFWFGRLFEDPDFQQKYIDRWTALRAGVFAPATILARVDEMAQQLNEAQARNFQRWPILGRYINPNYYVGNSYDEEVRWMKRWIQNRIAWIDSQFLATPSCSLKDGPVDSGASLRLSARSGKVYYTLDKTDPRLPGGSISPQAHLYNGPLTLKENASLFARARSGNTWSGPTFGNFNVHPAGSHP